MSMSENVLWFLSPILSSLLQLDFFCVWVGSSPAVLFVSRLRPIVVSGECLRVCFLTGKHRIVSFLTEHKSSRLHIRAVKKKEKEEKQHTQNVEKEILSLRCFYLHLHQHTMAREKKEHTNQKKNKKLLLAKAPKILTRALLLAARAEDERCSGHRMESSESWYDSCTSFFLHILCSLLFHSSHSHRPTLCSASRKTTSTAEAAKAIGEVFLLLSVEQQQKYFYHLFHGTRKNVENCSSFFSLSLSALCCFRELLLESDKNWVNSFGMPCDGRSKLRRLFF